MMPTVPLEPVVEDGPSARNFRLLGSVVGGLLGLVARNSDGFGFTVAGVGVRFGTVSPVWPGASAASTALAVTHGLGRTPVIVLATPKSQAGAAYVYATALSVGATTFTLQLAAQGAIAIGNPTPTSWLVIG